MHWLAGVICLAVLGCGREAPQPVAVQGQVWYRGEPLRQGVVAFVSDPQRNRYQVLAIGKIEADGRFVLVCESASGVPPGWYKVSVLSTGEPRLPEHYNDPNRSGLVCHVLPQPEQTIWLRLE